MVGFRSTALVLASLMVVACGGPTGPQPPPPDEDFEVSGTISLPSGHGIDLGSLSVVTPFGSYPVDADGNFTAVAFEGVRTEIDVETADGELLLVGLTQGATAQVSLTTTAESLLYYLVGGMWLPSEQQDLVRGLLSGHGEAVPIAAELQRLLLGGGNGMAEADEALVAAIEAAHANLFADVEPAGTGLPTDLGLGGAANTTNLLIHPSGARQAGAMVLHDQMGGGVVVLNELRRPATLLAYEVGWEDVDRVYHPVEPPEEAGSVKVPATGQLEFFNALYDVVTLDAPWAPVLSESLAVPMRGGATRSHYELVLLGPSIWGGTPAIMEDPRFASFQDEWDDIIGERTIDQFLEELLLPLLEVYTLGRIAKHDAAKLRELRQGVRAIYDNHLLGLGLYVRSGPGGYASGMRFVLEELARNDTLRLQSLQLVRDALDESRRHKFSNQVVDKRLAGRAASSAIAAAVQTVLVSGDVAKILYDLAGTPPAASWQAEVAPGRWVLQPGGTAVLGPELAHDVRMQVFALDEVHGHYMFRWTTSGKHGTLSDYLDHEAITLDTPYPDVRYFHNDPLNIMPWHMDTVTVEIFELEPGVEAIPDDALPIARLHMIIRGQDCPVPVCTPYNDGEICFCSL